jgi:hypothetical protein
MEKQKQANESRQETNINWILNSPKQTPISFFRLTHPTKCLQLIEKFKKCFDYALNRSKGDKLNELRTINIAVYVLHMYVGCSFDKI